MSLYNGYTVYHPHWYCTKFEFLSLLVLTGKWWLCFWHALPSAEAKHLLCAWCLFSTPCFAFLKKYVFKSSVHFNIFCCFLLSTFRPYAFWKVALHWTKLYILHHRACFSPSNYFSHCEKLLIEPYLSVPVSSFTCAFVVTLIKM